MVDYSWFKLFVRALGIVFIGLGGPTVLSGVVTMIVQYRYYSSQGRAAAGFDWTSLLMWGGSLTGSLLQLLFGLYLLFDGSRVINLCLRGVFGHCVACGYDVRDITGATCPECGVLLPGRSPIAARQAPAQPPST